MPFVIQIYGKSVENLRNRREVIFATNEKQSKRLISKPNFKEFRIINSNLTLVNMAKTTILFNKPIFVGAAVLDISKVHMYSFHYDYMMRKYMPEQVNVNSERDNTLFTDRISVLFTDTDSLVYQIYTDDFYRDMKEDMEQWYDTSDYPPSHPCHSKQNTKRLGFFKDETNGVPILEFIGLRAKMYSIRLADGTTKMTAKGIDRGLVKRNIKYEQYTACLEDYTRTTANFKIIRSSRQELFTMDISKIGLSPYDDKRYLLKNSPKTLAYGHYLISKK